MGSFLKILIAFGLVAIASPSFGQATRTWVSGVGDDANPCSRTAPCKTFAGAISKTLPGGEINCLDPGGFGAVTITKSITLDCTGTMGSILNSGTSGIIVNDSATPTPNTAEVIVKGLSIDGAGTVAGLNGIRFLNGRSLVLQDVFIQNETGGTGISFQPAGTAEFYAEDVTVTDGASGILVQPTGAGGSVRAVLRNVRVQNNSGTGLAVNSTSGGNVAGSIVVIDKSTFTGNLNGIAASGTLGLPQSVIMLTDSVISGSNAAGLSVSGGAVTMRVANSTITANTTGIAIAGSPIMKSYGTNRLDGNTTDGAFLGANLPQK